MTSLIVVLVLAADASPPKSNPVVSTDDVTVNAGKTEAHASGAATSASTTGQQWSVVSARTIGEGANMLQGSVGFPGVQASLLHGLMQNLDVGGRLTVNYGWEGQVTVIQPGLKVQGVARMRFMDNGKLNLGGTFAPGLLLYFPRNQGTVAGVALPVSATLGIVASSALNVGVTLETAMWIRFGTGGGLAVPILAGGGAEYFITSALCVWGDLRMGPTVFTNGTAAAFTFDGKVGVGWRF